MSWQSFLGEKFLYLFQLLEADCIPSEQPHIPLPSFRGVTCPLTLILLPSSFKDYSDYFGTTQIMQNNLFISRSLNMICKVLFAKQGNLFTGFRNYNIDIFGGPLFFPPQYPSVKLLFSFRSYTFLILFIPNYIIYLCCRCYC